MPPRNAPPAVDAADPDGLMAAAKAIETQPATPEAEAPVNPLPPPSIASAIEPVGDRVLEGLNIYERRAVAAAALRLHENGAFQVALNALREKYLTILMEQRVGSPDYVGCVSRAQTALVLLGELPGQLAIIVDSVAFDERAERDDLSERTRDAIDNAARATVKGGR